MKQCKRVQSLDGLQRHLAWNIATPAVRAFIIAVADLANNLSEQEVQTVRERLEHGWRYRLTPNQVVSGI